MSYLSDPDRLGRQAMYVLSGEFLPHEVAEALNDAADRMRRTEAQLTELLRPTRAKPIPFKHDGEAVGSAIVEQDAEGFKVTVTTDDPRFKGIVGSLPPLPWKFDDVHSFGFRATPTPPEPRPVKLELEQDDDAVEPKEANP